MRINSQFKILGSTVLITALMSVSGQVVAENPGGWEYSVAPLYLWAKNIEGDSGIGPVTAPLVLDFQDDILENLDAAFAIHFEAKQGDLTLFAEYNFARLDPGGEQTMGPITAKLDVEFEDTMWELGVAYAVFATQSTEWEVLGGVRYMEQDVDIDIDITTEGPGEGPGIIPSNITGGDDWWHGFGGVRVITKISERWSFRARADMGYKNSSNQSVQGIGMFDYRFRDWGSVFMGYRYLGIDYEGGSGSDRYAFDGDQQGPLLGFNFYF